MHTDAQGNRLTGATGAALGHFDRALAELRCYRGDPLAQAAAATAEAPTFTMAHCLQAHLELLGTEAAALPAARAALDAAIACRHDDRERGHIAALRLLLDGELAAGRDRLDDVLIRHPRDATALQAAHLWDFFLGDTRSLRDRVARALPA